MSRSIISSPYAGFDIDVELSYGEPVTSNGAMTAGLHLPQAGPAASGEAMTRATPTWPPRVPEPRQRTLDACLRSIEGILELMVRADLSMVR